MQALSHNEDFLYPQPYLRIPAKIASVIFHPLFIPTYVFFWLTIRFPLQFAGTDPFVLLMRKINVFWMTAFFPAFSVFLLWRLKLIGNIHLRTTKERIAPYIITMIFYWWMWYLSQHFTDQPKVLQFFYFGIFLTTIVGLISNIFTKISMHAMGVAGSLIFIIIACLYYHIFFGNDIAIATLITGLICTARLLLSEHTTSEVYGGLFAGAACQLVSFWLFI